MVFPLIDFSSHVNIDLVKNKTSGRDVMPKIIIILSFLSIVNKTKNGNEEDCLYFS